MTTKQPPLGVDAPLGEILLAETAIRIELPPSKHKLACDRYAAVRKHIERESSPLHERVGYFYPQGSMAIGATIQSHKRDEGYDIDIVSELLGCETLKPSQVLDLLFEAINGPKYSRYHGMVERQTRCVTVYYEDGMHIDITPSQLLSEVDPRRSNIFHAKPGEAESLQKRLLMNSWAFCEHFNARTPADIDFAREYGQRVRSHEAMLLEAAGVKEVPAHSTADDEKSATVVALQLLKRNRNIAYGRRPGIRMPPSVALAKIAADTSKPGSSIAEALATLSDAVLVALESAENQGKLIDIQNPLCPGERFTDRWPENVAKQRLYIDDLKIFRKQLAALMSPNYALDRKRELLEAMFGEGPAKAVVTEYVEKYGKSVKTGTRTIGADGRVIPAVAASAAIAAPAIAQPRNHTFFGERWKR